MEKIFFRKKSAVTKAGKRILLFLLPVLFLCLQTGCGGGQGTREDFSAYLDRMFRSEITASTLNMHYNLAHPENYGITDYKVTYGSISADADRETGAVLKN